MRLVGDVLAIILSQRQGSAPGRRSARHIIHNIRTGGHPHHRPALAIAVVTHTQTYNRHSPAAPRVFGGAQESPSQHLLRLDLGAPAADYCYPPMAATLDILAR
jgi:hypothetical protein